MMDYADSITAERVKRVMTGYNVDREETIFDVELTPKNLSHGAELLEEAKRVSVSAIGTYSSVKRPTIKDGHLIVTAISKAADQIPGTGGGFSYYELGEPLLIDGLLNPNVSEDKIRAYVYYTETRCPLPESSADEKHLLGVHEGHAYYFYYEADRLTTLNRAFLRTIQTPADGYLIYADVNALSPQEMAQFGITFKKIPRDIAVL